MGHSGTLSRRAALRALGGAAAGATLGLGGWAYAARGGTAAPGPEPTGTGAPLRDLPEIRSAAGLLEHTLTLAAARPVVGGRMLHLDLYNGELPGALLRFRPGDRLRILLRNRMRATGVPPNASPPLCAERPQDGSAGHDHGPDDTALMCIPEAAHHAVEDETFLTKTLATNLHTHGLQVSPAGDSDNVFLRVDPGQQHQYEYHVPEDQPAGMFWYHPHYHGSTAHQSWSGLAGPMVVEGDIDRVPEIADMRERVVVINALRVDEDGENPTALTIPAGGEDPFTTIPAVPTQTLYPLNGQLRPVATIRPGETQRWRVLNAAAHRSLWLHIEGHTLHRIGQDGMPFARPRPADSVLLAPANRTEFLLQGGEPGRYRIHARAYDEGHPGGDSPAIELGTLLVTGPAAAGPPIPDRLVEPRRIPDLPVARRRTITVAGDFSGRHGAGMRFLIDGRPYDLERVDHTVEAGTVEEWRFVNKDVFQHPMHIHTNPFQVIDVRGVPAGDATWQTEPDIWWDTFRLPPGGEITLRTYFRPDATGTSVFHCHVLPHEDNGMMANLLIAPAASEGADR